MQRNKVILITLFIASLAVAAFLYNKYRIAPDISFNSIQLEDLNGVPVSLSSFQNKMILLNFFATWCGPCVHEMPDLENIADQLGNKYVVLCISDEPLATLQRFDARIQVHPKILHSIKPFSQLKIFTFPTSYLLNTKQEVAFKKVGNIEWASEDVLKTLRKTAQ
jgi:thiol-disulfide isomerase/thioredoxin